MNQLLYLRGANAPPADWMPESSFPSKQVFKFGQPSFAEIFQMQAMQDPVPSMPFQSMSQPQNQVGQRDHSASDQMRMDESERYHHPYDEQAFEERSNRAMNSDPSADPIAAANAASVQSQPSSAEYKQGVRESKNPTNEGESGQTKPVVDGKGAAEVEQQRVEKSDRMIKKNLAVDMKHLLNVIGKPDQSSILSSVFNDTDSKISAAAGRVEIKQTDIKNQKSKSGTPENVMAALKSETLSQKVDKDGKAAKPAVDFSKAMSDQAVRGGENPQVSSTKKEVKVDVDIKAAGDCQVKPDSAAAVKTELTSRLGNAPSRMAESHSLNPAEQIIKNVEVMFKGDQTSMRLQLQPESLGKIELRLVQTDHGIVVALIPDESSTSTLLEKQLAELRSALTDSGIQLSELWVGQHEQAEQQTWWSKNTHFGKRHKKGDWDEDMTNLVVERRVSYSLSGLDYLI